ncbi:MAG: hypothetical protein H7343_17680 [Undibacterium sp.]|nr:hypothetical protein [Opitutaceae bacterium]
MNKNEKDLNHQQKKDKSRNPDPITGAPGSHPVGTGVGAAIGGAAAGAAVGTVAGPVGTIAGAAVGAIVGGLAGKGVAEKIDPTREDAYWRKSHGQQLYAKNRPYDDYAPAYRVGYEGYGQYGADGKTFDENEADLRRNYEKNPGKLSWDEARVASRAAWSKLGKKDPAEPYADTYGNPRKDS